MNDYNTLKFVFPAIYKGIIGFKAPEVLSELHICHSFDSLTGLATEIKEDQLPRQVGPELGPPSEPCRHQEATALRVNSAPRSLPC